MIVFTVCYIVIAIITVISWAFILRAIYYIGCSVDPIHAFKFTGVKKIFSRNLKFPNEVEI